jgi:hypothetical protein
MANLDATIADLQTDINEVVKSGYSVGGLSDGSNTYNELYQHRIELFLVVCRKVKMEAILNPVWVTIQYSDGKPVQEGWAILGLYKKAGKQITYNVPIEILKRVPYAAVLEKAPDYDGHTPQDVIERLQKL